MSSTDRRTWLLLLLLFGARLAGPAPALGDAAPSLSAIAGSYYEGDGAIIRRILEIRPNGTFEYEMEMGPLRAEAKGTASVAGRTLVLAPKTEKGEGTPVPRRLAIVPWGPRLYLVPEDGMLEFANMVNDGFEPRKDARGFSGYLRDEDWDKPVTGLPDLPAAHKPLLFPKPIEGKVSRKLDKPLQFEIDFGSGKGLKPGMKLTAVAKELESFDCSVTVVSTTETSSVVQGDEYCKGLPPGARICSRRMFCHGLE